MLHNENTAMAEPDSAFVDRLRAAQITLRQAEAVLDSKKCVCAEHCARVTYRICLTK
jgi:hypothetical protein